MSFPEEVVTIAWDRAGPPLNRTGGRCERCGKTLSWKNRGIDGAWGAWEAHHKTSVDADGSNTLSNCEILCLNCHKAEQALSSYSSMEDLRARVAQAKKDVGKKAKSMFLEGKNTIEIRKTLELQDLPFELFLEVLGFKNIKEWKRASSSIRSKQRARDKEGRTWSAQRKMCLERDKYRCIVCGKEASNTHHIIPYVKSHSHELDNLVTLCDSHHDAIHCNLSMYQKKELELVREYIKVVNEKFRQSLVLSQAFTTKSGTIYYRIREVKGNL